LKSGGSANTLYRCLPNNVQGGLNSLHAGGRLQGLKVRNVVNADLRFPTLCQEFGCEWVDIADPDLDGANIAITGVGSSVSASGPYRQAYANGAAIFGANEGCWVANGVVFFTDKATGTTTPVARVGVIWSLDLATLTLKAIFVSRDRVVGNSPDNICISPRGGLMFNEDGGAGTPSSGDASIQCLKLLNAQGNSYTFAKHNYNFTREQLDAAGKPPAPAADERDSEWAGSVFSPDGRVLFVNLYTPGITLASTGPWTKGNL
jgi:hypothetical protein